MLPLVMIELVLLAGIDVPYAGWGAQPVSSPHFPDRLHAFVWRNWNLVPIERLAAVVGAEPGQVIAMGRRMGLADPLAIPAGQLERSYISIIRRNWHLLTDDQLLELLDWTQADLAYTLREDDFLYSKLGVRPQCEPINYREPGPEERTRESEIAATLRELFGGPVGEAEDPLFGFIAALSQVPAEPPSARGTSAFPRRFSYAYFATYGDPLLDQGAEIYPEGYLARLAQAGVNGVWLHAVLYKLAAFPWDDALSSGHETRLRNLEALVARAHRYGIDVYLYLNEPRAMPMTFFENHPELKGVTEDGYAALCTSLPEVRAYVRDAVTHVCRSVPDLAGVFTITIGENRTVCWSHFRGLECPRCSQRKPADVVAEINRVIYDGMKASGSDARLIVWDWLWPDEWTAPIIEQLPTDVALMSVSEWGTTLRRGGVDEEIREYSMSAVEPGARALRHWSMAREHGLEVIAKVQVSNSWELSTVPYIPVVANVARHATALRQESVDGAMLSWTLGGYPSPGLEVFSEIGAASVPDSQRAMTDVATRRYGEVMAPHVVQAWIQFSEAFAELPFHAHVLYLSPVQLGAANLLWERSTGYRASMVGFPYDDLDRWCGPYSPAITRDQLRKVADGFAAGVERLRDAVQQEKPAPIQRLAVEKELAVAETCAIQYESVANQIDFVLARRALAQTVNRADAYAVLDRLQDLLEHERSLAVRLYSIQQGDSRIGFEASNQYVFVPLDLAEKVLNCTDLLTRWIPEERKKNSWVPSWM